MIHMINLLISTKKQRIILNNHSINQQNQNQLIIHMIKSIHNTNIILKYILHKINKNKIMDNQNGHMIIILNQH